MQSGRRPSAYAQKKAIISKIFVLFGLLILAIIGNAAYSTYHENKNVNARISQELDAKLEIVSSIQSQEVEKLAIISETVREQNQKFADFLDYDKLEPITTMLKTIAHLHAIDMVFLFDEDDNLLATNRLGTAIENASRYKTVIGAPDERVGIERIAADIVKAQLSEHDFSFDGEHLLCFKSVIHLFHDTGEICGNIVLVKLINANQALADQMARIAKANVVFYNEAGRAVLTSFGFPQVPYPSDRIIAVGKGSYIARLKNINDSSGETIGRLAVALDRQPF
ncbi:MAG: hypothetical protein JSW39_23725 [Desulfobacterales bacterium]|nr:MAG: hypothetical protein JSW39_23725 [Desulfobacterales bacterium]